MDTESRMIKIEDLEIGDEILVPSNSRFKYYKVIRLPRKNAKSGRWGGAKCSERVDKYTVMKWKWDFTSKQSTQVPVDQLMHVCTPIDHNNEKLVYGLQWRDIWLIRRETM